MSTRRRPVARMPVDPAVADEAARKLVQYRAKIDAAAWLLKTHPELMRRSAPTPTKKKSRA